VGGAAGSVSGDFAPAPARGAQAKMPKQSNHRRARVGRKLGTLTSARAVFYFAGATCHRQAAPSR